MIGIKKSEILSNIPNAIIVAFYQEGNLEKIRKERDPTWKKNSLESRDPIISSLTIVRHLTHVPKKRQKLSIRTSVVVIRPENLKGIKQRNLYIA